MGKSEDSRLPSPSGDSAADRDLFFGTLDAWDQYEAQAQAYFEILQGSASIRLIVLETWLFVDYAVRELLMSGFQLQKVDDSELDLRYNLLPRGLHDCVRLLKKLRDVNRRLPVRPEQPITGRSRKWKYFDEFDPGLSKRIAAAEMSYFETFKIPQPDVVIYKNKYRSVPEGWLDVADQIDEPWSELVNRLNGARNLAAHCHDEARIAARLGCTGPNRLELVRAECGRTAEDLVGVSSLLRSAESEITAP